MKAGFSTDARFAARLAWRETRGSWRQLAVLVGSITVGVAALVAIESFTDTLREGVRAQARTLLGADLALASGAAFSEKAQALADTLARDLEADTPERRARVLGFGAMVYVPRTSGARLAQVTAVEGRYPFYGAIETTPPGEWARLEAGPHVLVDPSLLVLLDARVGDTLALGEGRFEIRGTVGHMPGESGLRAALGPRVFLSARHVPGTGLVRFGSRVRYEVMLKLPEGADPQRAVDKHRVALAAERITLRTVDEDQRSLGQALGRLGRYLGLIALMALLLGGLGVGSAIHVFLQRRMETLAVLRCLGAPARVLFGAYLLQCVALALVGSVIGAAAGLAVQMVLPRVLADFLPLDVPAGVSWPAVGWGLVVGVWVAAMFALRPLVGIRRVSPMAVLRRDETPRRGRDLAGTFALVLLALSVTALSVRQAPTRMTGLAFAVGIGLVVLALAGAAGATIRALRRWLPADWPYVWRQGIANLHRPGNQTLMAILAVGFGAFLLQTLLLVQHNLLRDLRTGGERRANLVLFDVQPDQREAVEKRLAESGERVGASVPIVPMRIAAVKGQEVATQLVKSAAAGEERPGAGRWALRREYRSTYRDTVVSSEERVAGTAWPVGSWRDRAPTPADPLPVSLEEGVAREIGVVIGDTIEWDVQGLRVPTRVASLRDVQWARFEPNFFVVFPDGPLRAAPQTWALLARIEEPAGRARFQRVLAEGFPNVTTVDLAQVQESIERVLGKVAVAIRFMALFSLGTGAVVLLGSIASTRHQRLREGVLLRALGASRGQVVRVITVEYAVLGAVAALVAAGGALLASWALMRWVFETGARVPVPAFTLLGIAVVLATALVGLWSARDAASRPPLDVLRAE